MSVGNWHRRADRWPDNAPLTHGYQAQPPDSTFPPQLEHVAPLARTNLVITFDVAVFVSNWLIVSRVDVPFLESAIGPDTSFWIPYWPPASGRSDDKTIGHHSKWSCVRFREIVFRWLTKTGNPPGGIAWVV